MILVMMKPSLYTADAERSMDALSTDYTTRLLVNTQREDSDSAYYGSNRSRYGYFITTHQQLTVLL